MKLTLVFLFVALAALSFGQDWSGKTYKYHEIYPGYIIQENGDTLKGYVEHNDRIQNQNTCIFYSDASKKDKKKFKADDIKGYGVADKEYRSVNFSGGLIKKPVRFLLIEKAGRLTEFFWYSRDEGFIVQVRKGNETDAEYDERVSKSEIVWHKEGEDPVQYTALVLGFAKRMSKLLADHPELSKKIADKEKGYGLLNMPAIASEYNSWWVANKK